MTVSVSGASWRKSSYSGGGSANCVEVCTSTNGDSRGLRDSKNPGPVLLVGAEPFAYFLAAVKDGRITR
ncbi:DUF397 domain-containing protein [Actinoalloteichus spitiensis]|uniref:DUF397 domain-containing protein n=1 Tax=Actinoalloteichus spitiensis TaxID=252394 RepID=UPI000372277A|nr:DUF397 domain-containing protein [Actinoalloteichus spitiensis]